MASFVSSQITSMFVAVASLGGGVSVLSYDPNEHTVTVQVATGKAIVARHVSDQQIIYLRASSPAAENAQYTGITTILTSL